MMRLLLLAAALSAPALAAEGGTGHHLLGWRDILAFGKNRYGVTPVVAITHLPASGLELPGAAGLSFSTRNQATDYQTAPEFHFEGAIAQHLSRKARIGIAGYAYQQLGEDSGSGADLFRATLGTQSLKAHVFGIGSVAGHSTRIGGASATFKVKHSHEFEVRRRLQGGRALRLMHRAARVRPCLRRPPGPSCAGPSSSGPRA